MAIDADDPNRSQQRENADPEESIRPIPLTAAVITLVMVLFGVGYIFLSEPLADSALGDQRTLADLSGPPRSSAAAGVDGKALFAAQCVACHQASGQGVPGVFPPLDGSEWVNGPPRVLANILLHGVSGKLVVAGKSYDGAMPSFAHLGDAELAALASYIRASWSNRAAALGSELVAAERGASQRSTPFEGGAALEALGDGGG